MESPLNSPANREPPLREILQRAINLLEQSRASHAQFPTLPAGLALGLRIALRCTLDHGIPTFLVDSERSPEILVSWLLLVRSRIEPHSLIYGDLSNGDWRDLATVAARLAKSPLILERSTFASARVAVISGRSSEEVARVFAELGDKRNLVQAHLVSQSVLDLDAD